MQKDSLISDKLFPSQINPEEQQLYDYLFMRYYQLKCIDQSTEKNHLNIEAQLSSQLRQELDCLEDNSSVLYLCIENAGYDKGINQIGDQFQFSKQKLQGCRVVLAQVLARNYPSVFISDHSQTSIENILRTIIKKHSLLSILNYLTQLPPNTPNPLILQQIGYELNFFILAVGLSSKINLQSLPLQQIAKELLSHTSYQLVNINSSSKANKPLALSIVSGHLLNTFDKQKRKQPYKEKLSRKFNDQYGSFKLKYQTKQTPIDRNILQIHYLNDLLSMASKQTQFNQVNLSEPQSQNNQQSLNTISFFVQISNTNQSYKIINQKLLINFMTEPYQTSLFVLFKFLSKAGIRNIDKFLTKNNNQSAEPIFVNPLAFLLIDTKTVNRENSESLSLSLWVILSVWCEHVNSQSITQQTSQKQFNFLKNEKDPRKIYAIKKSFYSTIPQPQNTSIKSSNENCSSYIKELNCTLMMFLLTLDVETTTLKYYSIENDLLKKMFDSDVLPGLLMESKFALNKNFRDQQEIGRNSQREIQYEDMGDEEILQRIEQAQTVEEIQHLEKMLNQKKKPIQTQQKLQSLTTSQQIFTSESPFWLLPWICVIETKSMLPQLMRKPQGFNLALKLLSQRPNTFYKVYEHFVINQAMKYMKDFFISMENQKKQASLRKGYTFKGNRNVGLKKNIDYDIQQQKIKQNRGNNVKDIREKLPVIREIFEMHKGTELDQHLRQLCELMLKSAEKI